MNETETHLLLMWKTPLEVSQAIREMISNGWSTDGASVNINTYESNNHNSGKIALFFAVFYKKTDPIAEIQT